MTATEGSTPTPDEPGTRGVCTNAECSENGIVKALGGFAPEEIVCGSCGGPISEASDQEAAPGDPGTPAEEVPPDAG